MSAALTTNVDARQLRTTKFPQEFNVKVDMNKVNTQIIRKWVTDEIARILEIEDDIVTELISNMLDKRFPNIKELQIALMGFLDRDAAPFCQELWKLCVSAQGSPQGIPKELLEAKKQELAQTRLEEERVREQAKKRQEAEQEREMQMNRIRERERNDREGRGGGRDGHDFDRRPRRDSRSPPKRRQRDDDDFYRAPPSRGGDSYVPASRRDRDMDSRRHRSPSFDRARRRSRSPPPRRYRRSSSSPRRSRSPPRYRRYTDDRGAFREGTSRRKRDRTSGRGERYRPRPASRTRYRGRSPSISDPSRSPPPKRSRRTSTSRASEESPGSRPETSSQSPSDGNKGASLPSNDLMALTGRNKRSSIPDEGRLSRESLDVRTPGSEISIDPHRSAGAVERDSDRSRGGDVTGKEVPSVSLTASGLQQTTGHVRKAQTTSRPNQVQPFVSITQRLGDLRADLKSRKCITRPDSATSFLPQDK